MDKLEKYITATLTILVVVALVVSLTFATIFGLILLHDFAYPTCEHAVFHFTKA